ncbi:GtrA family protein [Gemella sanguinis]|uniref:GtrA family protein n=1 Tax=Gemella sanguinis TaxID=84135 RepID=UPI00352DC4B1
MKNLIMKMLDLYKQRKYKSIVNYIFFGVCTTLVNVVTYFILYYYGMGVRPANLISITLSILFAYFVNARYVFNSKAVGFKKVFYELAKFFTARLSTLVIEVFGVEFFIYLGMNAYLSKFIIQFVVLVANYVISKFLVFTKEKNN